MRRNRGGSIGSPMCTTLEDGKSAAHRPAASGLMRIDEEVTVCVGAADVAARSELDIRQNARGRGSSGDAAHCETQSMGTDLNDPFRSDKQELAT